VDPDQLERYSLAIAGGLTAALPDMIARDAARANMIILNYVERAHEEMFGATLREHGVIKRIQNERMALRDCEERATDEILETTTFAEQEYPPTPSPAAPTLHLAG
jgi:hypothetical protein